MVEELSSKVAKTEGENENLREELFNTEVKLENLQQKFPDFYIHRTWASFLSSGKLTKSDCPNLKYILKVIIKSLDIDKIRTKIYSTLLFCILQISRQRRNPNRK